MKSKPAAKNSVRLLRCMYLMMICFMMKCVLFGASEGTTAANFLKIPIGVRNVSMGETGAASFDINAMYYNPAGLGWLNRPMLTFTHNQHFQNVYYEHFAGEMPISDIGVFGASIYYLGMGKFQGYDASGNPEADVSAYDSAIAISYGRYIWGERIEGAGLSVGGTLKYIYSKLDDASASAVGLDIGAIYMFLPSRYTLENPLALGLSFQNIGSKMKYDAESAPLPFNAKLGLHYTFVDLKLQPIVMIDLNQGRDNDLYVSLGGEVWVIRELLGLRAGYVTKGSRETDSGLRFGIGLKALGLLMDYAYSGFGDLGISHRFGLTIDFSMPRFISGGTTDVNSIYKRGVEYYNQKRYAEAILEFNQVLELDPTNREALEYMSRANKEMNEQR